MVVRVTARLRTSRFELLSAKHHSWVALFTDTDPAINSFAAQNWTSHLGFNETQSWRPWTIDGCRRMGGYVTRYQGNFDFLTIRGAGHMVRVSGLPLGARFALLDTNLLIATFRCLPTRLKLRSSL
jgi:Serine carboxypeptidase